MAKRVRAREKIVQKNTRDGLREINLAEEEPLSPKLKKQRQRIRLAEEKLEKANEKIPTKKKLIREKTYDEAKGKTSSFVRVGEEVKKPNPNVKFHKPISAAANTGENVIHGKIYEVEKENVGVEAGHMGERTAEAALGYSTRKMMSSYRNHKLKPFTEVEKAKIKLEKETAKYKYQKILEENPNLSTNPISRFMQKRKIQREYAREVREAGRAGSTIAQNIRNIFKEPRKKIALLIRKGGKGLVAILPVFLVIILFGGGVSSCSSMLSGGLNTVLASSYTAEDSDINGAESDYLAKEIELRNKLNSIESDYPGYDEYRYNLAEIGHDPYELTSYLTVMYEDYTRAEVQNELQRLFNQQYVISYDVKREKRTRTEVQTQINYEWEWDEEIGDWMLIETEEEVEVEVEYDYWILTTTLTNNSLGRILASRLNDDQKERYKVLLETRGNRDGLFPDSPALAGGINIGEYTDYDIPPAALTDARFRNMITEAEKYLGYPYVWGGSSPSTSFDCSGFVSWVINHCGNGWNVGRLGAQGLMNICSIIPPSEAKPGDLIFFQGTYDTTGASHVAIYCGNNMMIHCGNPIQYANISHAYWQEHFYCFGRLN